MIQLKQNCTQRGIQWFNHSEKKRIYLNKNLYLRFYETLFNVIFPHLTNCLTTLFLLIFNVLQLKN